MDRQGLVTLVIPSAEMGQGIYTAEAMLLAEELEVGLDQVRLEHSPPSDALYANPLIGVQLTGGSTSVRARKGVVEGTSVFVRVDPGGRRIIQKKKKYQTTNPK